LLANETTAVGVTTDYCVKSGHVALGIANLTANLSDLRN